MSGSNRWTVGLLATCATSLVAATCGPVYWDPADLLLHMDVFDFDKNRVAEIVPGAPWIRPGPDENWGTSDDLINSVLVGDIDLVLRTGITGFSGAIPNPSGSPASAPAAVAEPFGAGTPVSFVVAASNGFTSTAPFGGPIVPPSLPDGTPVLVTAFADLDGDGFVGITDLDGNSQDHNSEEAELELVGRRLASVIDGQASGTLFISAGGPAANPLAVVLTAVAYTGPFDPQFMGGTVPTGPAVMTQLPFHPRLDPADVLGGGAPGPAGPDVLVAAEVASALDGDPSNPAIGEVFTIATDGSEPTVDLASVRSGAFARFGIAIPPGAGFLTALERPLRPGLDSAGAPALYEILQRLSVPDDGSTSVTSVRILPLDRLGNVADLAESSVVELRVTAPLAIVSPDSDGDPLKESFVIADAIGVGALIDDSGGTHDDPNAASIFVDDGVSVFHLDVTLPDPDVNDSGFVDSSDFAVVSAREGTNLGEPGFDSNLDLNGDTRIDETDSSLVNQHLGTSPSVP